MFMMISKVDHVNVIITKEKYIRIFAFFFGFFHAVINELFVSGKILQNFNIKNQK
jgi:hypothetical protein